MIPIQVSATTGWCVPTYCNSTFIEEVQCFSQWERRSKTRRCSRHNCPHCGTGTAEGSDSTVLVNGKPVQKWGIKLLRRRNGVGQVEVRMYLLDRGD